MAVPALLNDGGSTMAYAPGTCLEAYTGSVSLPQGVFALRDAGYFGCRYGEDYLVIDCGHLAPDYLIGHGHGDILSFEWSLAGRRIVVDQGTYQNLGGERRIVSRATGSHNTIAIDGLDQGDFFGAHRCGRRPRPELIEFSESDGVLVLEGRHDGYRHLQGAPWHRRRFEAHPKILTIEDEITGEGDWVGRGGFLLHPECVAEPDGDDITLHSGDVLLRITSDAALRLESAEWFPDLYCTLPTQRIRFEVPQGRGAVRTMFEKMEPC